MIDFFSKNKVLFASLIIYIIMFIIGIISLNNNTFAVDMPSSYSAMMFYILSALGFIGHFYAKKENVTYELLVFSMISILTGSYLLSFQYATLEYALGTGYLAFSLLTIVNRLYYIMEDKKKGDRAWSMRLFFIIPLSFLSILTIQNLYRDITIQRTMIGYYFLSYAIVSIIEVVVYYLFSPKKKMKKINKIDSDIDTLNKISKAKKDKI